MFLKQKENAAKLLTMTCTLYSTTHSAFYFFMEKGWGRGEDKQRGTRVKNNEISHAAWEICVIRQMIVFKTINDVK